MITVTMPEEQANALLDCAQDGLEAADQSFCDDAKLDRAEEAMALVRAALAPEDEDETKLGDEAAALGLCPDCGSLGPQSCGCNDDEEDEDDLCSECLGGTVLNDTCDDCGTRHCGTCDPCEDNGAEDEPAQ